MDILSISHVDAIGKSSRASGVNVSLRRMSLSCCFFCRLYVDYFIQCGLRLNPLEAFHKRFAVRQCLGSQGVNGSICCNEKCSPICASPVKVANILRGLDDAQKFSQVVENPDPARPRDPNVALFVAFHSIGYSLFELAVADILCERSSS